MIFSALLVCFCGFLIASIFGSPLYFFISGFALIVLNLEVLSLFKAISPLGILLLNTISLFITLYFWQRAGRPLLKPKINLKKFFNALELDKSLIPLVLGFLFMVFTGLILAVFMSTNEVDAQAYHVFRAYVFAKQGSLAHFVTADIRNLIMPINSEIFYTWIFALTKKDIGMGIFSFCSFLLAIGSLWGILTHFKYSIRKKLWCVLILFSLTGIMSQVSGTQTDITIGALFLASLLFWLRAQKEEKKGHYLYFSALSLALAFGVKSTTFIMFVPFLVLLYYFRPKAPWVKFFGFLAINFLIFSSYNYILNLLDFQNPFGSANSIAMHAFEGGFNNFLANYIRYIFQFFDFAFVPFGLLLTKFILYIQSLILEFLKIPVGKETFFALFGQIVARIEPNTSFGVLGFLVFLPSCVCAMFSKDRKIRTFGFLFFINLLMLSFALCYMTFSIRFIASFVLLSAPALVVFYRKKINFFKFIVVFIAFCYLTVAASHLPLRPYFRLLEAHKKSKNFEEFSDLVRCNLIYDFAKPAKECFIRDYVLDLKDVKRLAVVPRIGSKSLLLSLGGVPYDTLLLENIDIYDLNKYDAIIFVSDEGKQTTSLLAGARSPRCRYDYPLTHAACKLEDDYLINRGFSLTEVTSSKYDYSFLIYRKVSSGR